MRKLILTILLLVNALAGLFWAGLAIAENPPEGEPPAELPKTKTNEKDGAEMVLIPAGEFLMGTSEEELAAWLQAHPADQRGYFTNEMPQHMVYLDDYYMYKTEVTVAQYREFCQATGRAMPSEPSWKWQDDHPIVNIAWEDAQAYAAWAGASLPTEAQWEKAARGGDRRIYSWGDAWPPPAGTGNFGDETFKASGMFPGRDVINGYIDGYVYVSPVGAFAANPYGLHDMGGNVGEWCADWYGGRYYTDESMHNPTGPATGTGRVCRGGSWLDGGAWIFRAADRYMGYPADRNSAGGFRCVIRSPDPPIP